MRGEEAQGKELGERERLHGRACERKRGRERQKKRKGKSVTERKRVDLRVCAGCRVHVRADEGWIKRGKAIWYKKSREVKRNRESS